MRRKLIKLFAAISLIVLTMPGVSLAIPYSNMFVLGDSLSDVGNLFIATNNQLPQNPPYFQGRFSDGPIYAEHLWEQLGLSGVLTPSFAGGTNYAVGGARTRYHALDGFSQGFDPLSENTSFSQFTLLGQRDALLTAGVDSGALYTVWIGSNDVADAFGAMMLGGAPRVYADALLSQSANDLVNVITDLVGAGAQELLIPNVPNLGLVPEVQDLLPFFPSAQALATEMSQAFNDLVDALLADVSADITRLDTFQHLTNLVNDPTLFGLPAGMNVIDACFDGYVGVPGTVCPNPEEYIFWDMIHPSAVTHQVLGRVAVAAIPEPMTLALMGLGLAGIGYKRRKLIRA